MKSTNYRQNPSLSPKDKAADRLTVLAGLANMVLDYLFIVPFGLGIAGAALATAAGYCIPAFGGLIFFFKNKHGLHFSSPKLRPKILVENSFNGSSEMVTNLSASVTTLLFNIMMMRFAGPDGVAAITVVLYCQFLMTALFLGFSIGVAPIISYHYGAQNHGYLKKLIRRPVALHPLCRGCHGFVCRPVPQKPENTVCHLLAGKMKKLTGRPEP